MTTDNIISVRNLEKVFSTGNKIKALNGVSADIKRGEVVVVIGPSGSGKSTFLRCLNLLELPTGGTITFEGVDITDPKVNINHHRQKMGMVFQHFNLFPNMTVLKNLTLAPMNAKGVSREDADALMDALMKLYPNTEIILTLGAKGAMCGSKEGVFSSAAVKSTVVDTTAAGDTFTGYYLTLRAEGASIQQAMDTANLAASVTVSRKGASDSIPWRSELAV